MPTLELLVKFGIYAVMLVSVLFALGAVLLPNIFHASLAFVVTLLGIAGIFFSLRADFLAVVQILLYVGAVMTLVIFAIMLTQGLGKEIKAQKNDLALVSGAACFVFFIALARALCKISWPFNSQTLNARVSTADIGNALLGHFVFPFEVISVILLAVLVGAVIIAKKDKES